MVFEHHAHGIGAGTRVAHDDFDHVALFHRGCDDLVAQAAPLISKAVGAGEAVFVSLDEPSCAGLAEELGMSDASITFLPGAERYSRPGVAMRLVHDFVQRAVANDVPRVWSIGRIPDDGVPGKWERYEAAVNDVLCHLPLAAVCAFDTSSCTDELLDTARRTHRADDAVDSRLQRMPPDDYGATLRSLASGPPAFEFAPEATAAARAAVVELGRGADVTRRHDLELVVTEIMTNLMRHGTPPACLRMWRHGDDIVLQGVDHGPGIDDPFPDLRPPLRAGAHGGFGLWVIGQAADHVDIWRHNGATMVTASVNVG